MILTPGIYEIISKPWRKPIAREQLMSEKKIPLKPYVVTDPSGKEHLVFASTTQGSIAAIKALRTPPKEAWSAVLAGPDRLISAGRQGIKIHNDPNPQPESEEDPDADRNEGTV